MQWSDEKTTANRPKKYIGVTSEKTEASVNKTALCFRRLYEQ